MINFINNRFFQERLFIYINFSFFITTHTALYSNSTVDSQFPLLQIRHLHIQFAHTMEYKLLRGLSIVLQAGLIILLAMLLSLLLFSCKSNAKQSTANSKTTIETQ